MSFEQVNILKAFPDYNPDIIVSNPPYVTEDDRLLMAANVLEFEPHLALFSDTPLQFYEAIAHWAKEKMSKGGKLYLEINEAFGEEVLQLLDDEGFGYCELKKDLDGKDRMVKAIL